MNIIGVDIGGTKCAVVLGDERGNVKEKIRFATEDAEGTLKNIVKAAKKLSEAATPDCCGISCGGPLDEKKGLILSPPNLPDWDKIPIKKILEEATRAPAFLCNDANACALAEHRFGAGRGAENMIFLTFGTGLGAGIIANGKLLRGACGLAGEVGHIRLCNDGPEGYGKKGSFEGFCSGSGLARLGKIVAEDFEKRGVPVLWKKSCEVALMAEFARKGDEAAREVFRISGEMLGRGISILVDLFNPEKIIIGSVYVRCADLLEKEAKKFMEREALGPSCKACQLFPALLGEKIGDVAALTAGVEGLKNEIY